MKVVQRAKRESDLIVDYWVSSRTGSFNVYSIELLQINLFILQKTRRKEQKRGDENATNGLDPFDDDDDEDKLRDMARRFEAKYVR